MTKWNPKCRETIDGNGNLKEIDGIIEKIDGKWCQTEPSGRGLVEQIGSEADHWQTVVKDIQNVMRIFLLNYNKIMNYLVIYSPNLHKFQ
jgi:hypothetical protein